MKITLKIFLCLMLLTGISGVARADKVVMKDGEVLEGDIIEKNEGYLKLRQGKLMRQIFKFQYESYEDDPDPLEDTSLAATPAKLAYIKEIIKLTGIQKNLENNVKVAIEHLPDAQKKALQDIVKVDEMIALVIPLYDKYYTEDELKALVDFYRTPLGKKLIAVTPEISGGTIQATIDYFQGKLQPKK